MIGKGENMAQMLSQCANLWFKLYQKMKMSKHLDQMILNSAIILIKWYQMMQTYGSNEIKSGKYLGQIIIKTSKYVDQIISRLTMWIKWYQTMQTCRSNDIKSEKYVDKILDSPKICELNKIYTHGYFSYLASIKEMK